MSTEAVSVVARRISAVPARTSSEAWHAIVELVSEPGSAARADLTSITSIAAILISEEYTREAPIVVMPATGPRIRIHTVHGMDSIDHLSEETPLYGARLAEPGWQVSLPCGTADLTAITADLAGIPAVTVRDTGEGFAAQPQPVVPAVAGSPVIDLAEMRRT